MKLGTLLLILTQCFLIISANRAKMGAARIIGGHEAVAHSHPYMVSLQIRVLWVRAHYCGGALISNSWVLTAGHCLHGWIFYLLGIDAVAGAHNVDFPESTAQIISVSERIPHPEYKGDIGPNDIGLVRTMHPFHFTNKIQPINLPMDSIVYPKLTLVGWGELKTTWFFPALPSKLQEVSQEYVPHEQCYNTLENLLDYGERNPLVEDANICTGPLTGGIAACSGDSGGPLIEYAPVIKRNNTTSDLNNSEEVTDEEDALGYVPVILGIVSWGVTPCGEKGAPTVFTNIFCKIKFGTLLIIITQCCLISGITDHINIPFHFTDQIQPIKLLTDSKVYPKLTLVGWGELRTTIFFTALPAKLQEVSLEYVPHEECVDTLRQLDYKGARSPLVLVQSAYICTVPLTGGIGACHGDSGGPLIEYVPVIKQQNITSNLNTTKEATDGVDNPEFVPVLLGIASWGYYAFWAKE